MKLAALISGGKDSYMFHSANIHLTRLISEATGIALTSMTSSGEKEKELEDLKKALSSVNVDGVIAGAIESQYQTSRVRRICEELGLELYAPLWQKEAETLLREMILLMDIRMVKV